MCWQISKYIYISIKSKPTFVGVVIFAFSTLIILGSLKWNIVSIFTDHSNPDNSAKRGYLRFKHTINSSSMENKSETIAERNITLVDVPQLFSDMGLVYNISEEKNTNIILKILWFNRPVWFEEEQEMCNRNINRCFQGNCLVTYNTSLLKEADAVIFDATAGNFPHHPPHLNPERDSNQVWIFFGLESPFYYESKKFQSKEWKSMFNWTMTYRLDSDIPHPYGILLTNHYPPERNYREIFRSKTKFAAWIVSHCNTVSKRDDFVRHLQKYIPVDIFGKCGTTNCTRKGTECRDTIGKDYKFYLSFENSLCKDYITEKFFNYFPLDLITVQRGYSDYNALLPNGSFINSADFSTVQELAHYMLRLAEDEDNFTSFLKSKDRYISKSLNWTYCNALCNICNKLTNREKYKKSYDDIFAWLEKDACGPASDIT